MIRLLFILVAAGAIALGAAWLADHDGVLTLSIAGYEIRTSAALAAVLILALVGVLLIVMRLILGGPAKLSAFLATRRARKAYRTLSRGLLAAAAGDTLEAEQAARHAEKLLGAQPLALLLKAQAAQLSGDEKRQDTVYRAMLNHSETEFFALRGLYALAMRRHDTQEALALATRAHGLRAKAPETAEALQAATLAAATAQEASLPAVSGQNP